MIPRTVAWILRRCGESITLVEGERQWTTRAVIQPIAQNAEEKRLPTAMGYMDEGRYLYLGLPQDGLEARRHTVIWRGKSYNVQSAHPIYVGGGISHWWAILVRTEEETL